MNINKPKTDDSIEYILKSARDHDVQFIRLWFTDILGHLKGFAITVEELEEAFQRGVTFDGSAIDGFARADESDMIAMPDPSTFRILPWRPKEKSVARLFCDIIKPGGNPFECDSRLVLKKTLNEASNLGLTYYVGTELEYFYFKDNNSTEVLDNAGYFDQISLELTSEIRRETVLTLADMGILVKYSHHEVSPSQHEIDLQYTDALTMADTVMTAKLAIKEIALKNDVYATFMPKPLTNLDGSGMHIHQSLFQKNKNVFFDEKDENKLSPIAKYFMAGLLKYAREISIISNQWINSYTRLVPGFEAPVNVVWSKDSKSSLIRIPAYKHKREESVRIEYRAPDPACNPYLLFSVLLGAGLEGIQKKYSLPAKNKTIHPLPVSLKEAINFSEQSTFLKKILGNKVFKTFIDNKKIEWEAYRGYVTDFEKKQYLSIL